MVPRRSQIHLHVNDGFASKQKQKINDGRNEYTLMSLPHYAECKALIWTSECMKTMQILDVELATNCFELVKDSVYIGLDEFHRSKDYFSLFNLQHVLRAMNIHAG